MVQYQCFGEPSKQEDGNGVNDMLSETTTGLNRACTWQKWNALNIDNMEGSITLKDTVLQHEESQKVNPSCPVSVTNIKLW